MAFPHDAAPDRAALSLSGVEAREAAMTEVRGDVAIIGCLAATIWRLQTTKHDVVQSHSCRVDVWSGIQKCQ